jgi:hypothetical protein
MHSTDGHFNGFHGGREGIIHDHTQAGDDNDMNDMSTDEDGGTTAIRAAAMEVETMAKAAFPTQHQVLRCGQRPCEMKGSGVSIADRLIRSRVSFCIIV